jgi:hypothetical protein
VDELRRLGVAEAVCPELARRLAPLVRVLSPEFHAVALAGVSIAHRVHREREAALEGSIREITELQRLLCTFADELSKLDEALCALTAQRENPDVAAVTATAPLQRRLH